MPIFQPIVESTPTPIRAQGPVQRGAGLDTLFQGIGNALKVGVELFSNEAADPNEFYVREAQKAAALKQQGKTQEAKKVLRNAGIEMVRLGGDPTDDEFVRVRELYNLPDDFAVPDNIRFENAIQETPQYQMALQSAMSGS
jgi:hypothetical protein